MNARAGWFEVNRTGLARVAGRRTKIFILRELVQNSWDEASNVVSVEVHRPSRQNGLSTIRVTDDSPEGFADLSHAYTLFAPSAKVTDAGKRGRFNFGEKLVLALCSEARIETTKGTILFDRGETRRRSPKRREAGAMFEGLAGDDGMLRSQYRTAKVRVYEVLPGEKAHLYEMGIPVVETGDRWHVDIGQKVPLNMERDNVSPAYLQDVRVSVANATRDMLTVADANSPWARDALADYQCTEETARRLVELRFGDQVVIHDPSDQEANQKAQSEGYVVVTGSQLSSGEWEQVRKSKAMMPAGRMFPTPKAFHEGGEQLKVIQVADWTEGMKKFARIAGYVSEHLIGKHVGVVIANDPGWNFEGVYGQGQLTINAAKHGGPEGFDYMENDCLNEAMLEFLIHELAHDVEANHLSARYHDALCRLGGKLARLALDEPSKF